MTHSAVGHTVKIVNLVPAVGRNVVLAKLALPVVDVAPARIAATAPAVGDALRVAGFGRTADQWVPDQLSTAKFAVDTVSAAALTVVGTDSPDATTCMGDAGGPAFREVGGQFELAAIHDKSWQNGCYTSTETRKGTFETRVDDLASWVQQVVAPTASKVLGKMSAQCLDQSFVNGQAQPLVQAWQCWDSVQENQRWVLNWVTPDSVTIVNKLSGQCLDQSFVNGQAQPLVQAWQCWASVQNNQRWVVQPHYEDNSVSLVNKASGQCLDQDYTGGQPHPGLQAWQCWEGSAGTQRWVRN
jgi:hypothetical protein